MAPPRYVAARMVHYDLTLLVEDDISMIAAMFDDDIRFGEARTVFE